MSYILGTSEYKYQQRTIANPQAIVNPNWSDVSYAINGKCYAFIPSYKSGGTNNQFVSVFNLDNNASFIRSFKTSIDCTQIACDDINNRLYVASYDGIIQIYNLLSPFSQIGTDYPSDMSSVSGMTIDPISRLLYVGAGDSAKINIYDVSSDSCVPNTIPNIYTTGSSIGKGFGLKYDINSKFLYGCSDAATNGIYRINTKNYTDSFTEINYFTLNPISVKEYPLSIQLVPDLDLILIGSDSGGVSVEKYVYFFNNIFKLQVKSVDLGVNGGVGTATLLYNKNTKEVWFANNDSTSLTCFKQIIS
jgi:hypothetical protein